MKYSFLSILVFSVFLSFAQEKVVFKVIFKPNKLYKMSMKTDSKMKIDFVGDQAVIDQIKASGTKLPMLGSSVMEIETTTTTGKAANKTIPARIVYDNMVTIQVMNDKEIARDNSVSGLIIEGFYDQDSKLQVDTMISDKLDESMKAVIRSTMENIQAQIKFPTTPMKKGDTFEQKIPMEIPTAGLSPIKVVVTTVYTLVSIKKEQALFDLIQTVTLDMETEQGNINATGDGKGISVFDIAASTITKYEANLDMNLEMLIQGMTMKMEMKTNMLQLITVE